VMPDGYSGVNYNVSLVPGAPGWKQPATCVPVPALPSWMKLDCSTSQFAFSGAVPNTVTSDIATTYNVTVIDANNEEFHYTFKLTLRPSVESVPLDARAAQAEATAAAKAAVPPAPPDFSKLSLQMTVPIQEGQNQAAGQISNIPANVTLYVQVWSLPDGKALSQVQLTNPAPPPATVNQVAVKSGSFAIQFGAPISSGQTLSLIAVTSDGTQVKTLLTQPVPSAIPIGNMSVQVEEPVTVGSSKITGKLSEMPTPQVAPTAASGNTPATYGNYPGIVVWWTDPVSGAWSQAAPTLGTGAAQFLSVNSDGSFSVTLPSALRPGQQVRIDAVPPPGRSFIGPAPIPPLPPPPFPVPPAAPSTTLTVINNVSLIKPAISTSPLTEGTTVITGIATPAQNQIPSGIVILRVKEQPGGNPFQINECLRQDTLNPGDHGRLLTLTSNSSNIYVGSPDATTGQFKVTLTQALKEGEWIQVVQVVPAESVLPLVEEAAVCASTPIKVSYPFNFYRTNLTFVAGVLLSNSGSSSSTNANFSQANQFYAFNADHAWRAPGYDCVGAYKWGDNAHPFRDQCDSTQDRWHAGGWPGVSSFFEARLTAIPVSTASATVTASSSGGGSSSSSGTSSILTSQKVLRVETGAYLPWVIVHGSGEHPNGLFIAPIAKAGFDTVTGANAATNVILPGGTVGTLNFQSAYDFFVFGGRIGNMALSQSRDRAPQVEHYLDTTIGRYSNLQSFVCHTVPAGRVGNPEPGTSCPSDYPTLFPSASSVIDSRKSLYRLDFEGLVRIPIPASQIPFYIGFNANIAQHTLGAVHLDHGYAPPDDIRLLFATRIDIGSLLTSLNLGAH